MTGMEHILDVDEAAAATQSGVKALRLVMVDAAGLRRCRVVPGGRAPEVFTYGVGISKAVMGIPFNSDTLAAGCGLSLAGEVVMMPVESSTVDLPWSPGHRMAPVELHKTPGMPWECCPRSALKKAIKALQDEYGVSLRAKFITEFTLYRTHEPNESPSIQPKLNPATQYSGHSSSHSLDALSPVLDEIVSCLMSMGIEVLEYWPGSGPGQFTISTGQFEALEGADMLVMTREAVAGVARRYGLAASFLPVNSPLSGGSRCHLELMKDGQSMMGTYDFAAEASNPGSTRGASDTCTHFLAGMVITLPCLTPFLCSSIKSYQCPPAGSQGLSGTWGWHHQELPLNLVHTRINTVSSINIECRLFDGSTNPYIGLTALVAAGLMGFYLQAKLPQALQVPASTLTEAQLTDGNMHRLPRSPADALDCFKSDNKTFVSNGIRDTMTTLLGPDLLQAYLAVKGCEAESGRVTVDTVLRF